MPVDLGVGTGAMTTIVTPIVASIEHPSLRRLGKSNIRTFLTEREAYVREITERSAQENGSIGRPVSLSFSIDPPVLESLVDLRQFGNHVTKVSEVTDELLLAWLEKHRDIKKDGLTASQVQTIVSRSLRINMTEKDCEQQVIILFADYNSLLRKNGMACLVEENTKMAVNHVTEALKPSAFKKREKDDLNFGHIGLKKDFLGFMQHVIRRAEQYSDYEEPEMSSQSSEKPPGIPVSEAERASGQSHRASTTKPPSAEKPKTPPDFLNLSCSLKNFLKECSKKTKERKDELYAELAERRRSQGEQRSTRSSMTKAVLPLSAASNILSTALLKTNTAGKAVRAGSKTRAGRLAVSFQSVVEVTAIPDSGADDNVIPRSPIQKLEEKGVFVPVRTLKSPIRVELAVQGPGLSADVRQQAQLIVELYLAAGPLRLRN
jgi:hypothetical protein